MARPSANLNKHVRGNDEVPVASASRSASANTAWLNSEEFNALNLTLDITVDNFTTLDVSVETASDSSGTNGRQVGAFAQQSGVATVRKTFVGFDKYYRIVQTLVGTSGTWSVTGESK